MILNKVISTIKKYHLIRKNDKILVGISGGPDSVALLYLLRALEKPFKISLYLAHLDHKLRPDSYRDREFIEKLALKLKLPLAISRVDIKRLAKHGSVEEIARNARLGFLFAVAKKVKADKIALGHNLDDQAETVLMRILRGAGLYGLSGILPKREIAGFTIIRPLIEIRRSQIEAFLKQKKIKPRLDTSNLEDLYFRNKIRNRLLPLLAKEYNKNIKEVLSNMAESLSMDYDYLIRLAQKSAKRLGPRLNLDKLMRLHPALRRLVLRLKIASVQGNMRRLTYQHMQEIEDLLFYRPINSRVDLPKGISIIKKKAYLLVAKNTITT